MKNLPEFGTNLLDGILTAGFSGGTLLLTGQIQYKSGTNAKYETEIIIQVL